MWPDDGIHLWLLPQDAVRRFSDRIGGTRLLTAAERQRMTRLRGDGARLRFLGARLLSRHALSARTGLPPEVWRFRTTGHGRPEPEPAVAQVRFNLSHTEGLIACVVTHARACGVDVERTPASPDAVVHLPRHFAAAERMRLAAVPPGPRAAAVAAYWVLKEAYLKALGTGMSRDPAGFALSPPGAGRIRVDDPRQPAERNARWHFELLYPRPGHVLAIAVDGGPGALHRVDLPG